MNRRRMFLMAMTMALFPESYLLIAHQAPAGQGAAGGGQGPTPPPMSFFVTSVGKGDGANYGGLAGADAWCQQLAAQVGRGGATWHAYLSTQGPSAVNARDRIGNGPWYNARGQMIAQNLAELHGDTLEQARLGNRLGRGMSLTEKGTMVDGFGAERERQQHDILTGSQPDGRAFTDNADHTCHNYTSDQNVEATAQRGPSASCSSAVSVGGGVLASVDPANCVMVGHSDKQGGPNGSWNHAHASRGCSQANLISTGGAGFLYCFAVN